MIGFTIKLFGTDIDNFTGSLIDYSDYQVLGLDYEVKFLNVGERGEHGGYRNPSIKEKTMTLGFYPVSCDDYDDFVNGVFQLFSYKYVYFNRGTHFTKLTTDSTVVRIVATGSSIEHTYNDGTKSLDIEVAVYE